MRKTSLLMGAAVGYVLGSRAGRERYEQIKAAATRVVQDPRVRDKATEATDKLKETAPAVKDKMTGAAAQARDTVRDRTGHAGDQPADRIEEHWDAGITTR